MKIQELKEKIDNDIEKIGGIEQFNQCEYAPEIIVNWIDKLLNLIENLQEED